MNFIDVTNEIRIAREDEMRAIDKLSQLIEAGFPLTNDFLRKNREYRSQKSNV